MKAFNEREKKMAMQFLKKKILQNKLLKRFLNRQKIK